MAGTPLELGFSAPSSADTGDNLLDVAAGFDVSFGEKITGNEASGGGGASMTSPLGGWVNDIAKAVIVGLAVKFLWGQMK